MASTATRRISCGASPSASLSGLVYIGATGRRRDVYVQGRHMVHRPAATRMGRVREPDKPRSRGVFKFSVEFLGGTLTSKTLSLVPSRGLRLPAGKPRTGLAHPPPRAHTAIPHRAPGARAGGSSMSSDATSFVGTIPAHYDRDLGPLIFADYAADTARRVAALGPTRVLETAAGTGIVTRRLRDLLPAGAHITATDLNAPMLEV